jgi:hypothetical protein
MLNGPLGGVCHFHPKIDFLIGTRQRRSAGISAFVRAQQFER